MIVIGYQGIGKSTTAKMYPEFIDLESSNFFIDGERAPNWYIPYCNIAVHLSKQGKVVFTSSHKVVRDRLKEIHGEETVVVCVPSHELKEEWIEKLQSRYDKTNSDKDFKALMNAKSCFDENIDEIMESGFPVITIDDMDYVLYDEVMYDERP